LPKRCRTSVTRRVLDRCKWHQGGTARLSPVSAWLFDEFFGFRMKATTLCRLPKQGCPHVLRAQTLPGGTDPAPGSETRISSNTDQKGGNEPDTMPTTPIIRVVSPLSKQNIPDRMRLTREAVRIFIGIDRTRLTKRSFLYLAYIRPSTSPLQPAMPYNARSSSHIEDIPPPASLQPMLANMDDQRVQSCNNYANPVWKRTCLFSERSMAGPTRELTSTTCPTARVQGAKMYEGALRCLSN